MMQSATQQDEAIGERLEEVLAVHFDPIGGAPYWLRRAEQLGFDPRREIKTVADLTRLGIMEPDVLGAGPLEDFIPRSILEGGGHLVVAQTGGTLGRPVWTAYLEEEFEQAFVQPFVAAAKHVGFPNGGRWLYVGPSGPHLIGRAADAIARACGAPAPFAVDFDARWAKKLPADSFAAQRYIGHVVEQAIHIIQRQDVTVIFTTPPILQALAESMNAVQRERVVGLHYGGMLLAPSQLERFQSQMFPKAVHLSGYGNTLFGCCLELDKTVGRSLCYYPFGRRLIFGVAKAGDGLEEPALCYQGPVQSGRLVFSRLDRTMLLVNMLERDQATLIHPPGDAPAGFAWPGLDSPCPGTASGTHPTIGLY